MTQSPYTVTWEILEDSGKVILDKARRPDTCHVTPPIWQQGRSISRLMALEHTLHERRHFCVFCSTDGSPEDCLAQSGQAMKIYNFMGKRMPPRCLELKITE